MYKRVICFSLAALLLLSACYVLHAWTQQRALSAKLIRLHVIANSDSESDQAQKLLVRDAILAQANLLTRDAKNVQQAADFLNDNLDSLQYAAQQRLAALGNPQPVSVSLTKEPYATRCYDTFTLPAGEYLSVQVKIGAAAGHNWWCVVFPSLCTSASTQELWSAAEAGSFSEEQTQTITEGETKYVLKFKTLELLQQFLSWIA